MKINDTVKSKFVNQSAPYYAGFFFAKIFEKLSVKIGQKPGIFPKIFRKLRKFSKNSGPENSLCSKICKRRPNFSKNSAPKTQKLKGLKIIDFDVFYKVGKTIYVVFCHFRLGCPMKFFKHFENISKCLFLNKNEIHQKNFKTRASTKSQNATFWVKHCFLI